MGRWWRSRGVVRNAAACSSAPVRSKSRSGGPTCPPFRVPVSAALDGYGQLAPDVATTEGDLATPSPDFTTTSPSWKAARQPGRPLRVSDVLVAFNGVALTDRLTGGTSTEQTALSPHPRESTLIDLLLRSRRGFLRGDSGSANNGAAGKPPDTFSCILLTRWYAASLLS